MKKKSILMFAAVCMLFMACSGDDNDQFLQQPAAGGYPLTVVAGMGTTRATYAEDEGAVNTTWMAGDMLVCVYNGSETELPLLDGVGTSTGTFSALLPTKPAANDELVFYVKNTNITIDDSDGSYTYNEGVLASQPGTLAGVAGLNVYRTTATYGDGVMSLTFHPSMCLVKFTVTVPECIPAGSLATLTYSFTAGETENTISAPFTTVKAPATCDVWMCVPAGTYTANTLKFTDIDIPAIAMTNKLSYTDTEVTLTAGYSYTKRSVFDPASLFTINEAGSKVKFSRGNLQATYDGTSWSWNFAENQWDYIGNAAGNTKVTATAPFISEDATVDLFGWVGASSIWRDVAQYGITSSSTMNNTNGYGNDKTESLKSDWGTLTIGVDPPYKWRTLTSDEWTYIFNTRSGSIVESTSGTISNARYTLATINTDGTSVNGVILFPDGMTIASSEITTLFATLGAVNAGSAWDTKCTTAMWTALAAKGCVFLPAAGNRNGTTVTNAGTYGYYWSSSPYTPGNKYAYYAYHMSFFSNNTSGNVYPATTNYRNWGCSVRLVRQVE